MLRKIILENWRSHRKSEIELRSGANMFLGDMGSGKSSVVDAICFALYGTYPKLGRRDAKIENVRNFRYSGDKAAVELTWVDSSDKENEREFRVRRELEPAGAWLYADSKLICKGARPVREEVEKILQISYELFARAVYAEQNRLDYWINLSAGERKTEIDSLLNLDKFERVRSEANRDVLEIRKKAKQIEQEVDSDKILQVEQNKKECEKKLRDAEILFLDNKKTFEKLSEEREKIDEEFVKVDLEAKKFRELGRLADGVDATILSLRKNIEQTKIDGEKTGIVSLLERQIKTEEDAQKNIEEQQCELREIIEKKSKLRVEISQMKGKSERKKMLEQSLLKIIGSGSVAGLLGQREELEKNLQKMRERKAGLESKIGELAKIIEAFEAGGVSGAKCPMCESELEGRNLEKICEHKMEERVAGLAQVSEIGKKIEQDSKLLFEIDKKIEDAKRFEIQINEIGEILDTQKMQREFSEIEKNEGKKNALIEQMGENMKKIRVELEGLRSKLEKIKMVERWRNELLQKEEQKKKILRDIEKTEFSEKKYEEILARKHRVGNDYSAVAQKVEGQKKICEQAKTIYENQKKEYERLVENREQALKLRESADEISKFSDVVVVTQAQLRESLIGEINSAMNKLWPIIYPYGDWQNVRLLATQKDYELQIYQGEWKNLEAHASGGERACLGLCLRAAMSVILTPYLGWLILDEPTHNLDSSAVRALGESISNSMPKIIPQVLVITHDSNLLESANSRVLRFERNKIQGEDTRVFEA